MVTGVRSTQPQACPTILYFLRYYLLKLCLVIFSPESPSSYPQKNNSLWKTMSYPHYRQSHFWPEFCTLQSSEFSDKNYWIMRMTSRLLILSAKELKWNFDLVGKAAVFWKREIFCYMYLHSIWDCRCAKLNNLNTNFEYVGHHYLYSKL